MMNNFTYAQATIHDLEDAVPLFDQYRIFYGQESDETSARAFLFERLVARESVIFIAKDRTHEKAVGFMQLYPSFSSISLKRSWILNDLYVVEAYRGNGIAQQLLEEARNYAGACAVKGIELATAQDNVRAQRLYERNGYKKDEQFYHYYLTL
ncbi:GNAT family N-acetyltransferase [Paenibacillus radicis (ex Xue et al. 2023)]|uniref:GNAT family N-acetyltransferase n=1 Tax=Paenibacillus radicis (ex Xue et al. 2023) TaxID=2972489 RepID=A0ABT1YBB7_9BACL|nr:GNAT family N-acetyltransferase [Paenibacillus radicis (ex Xue et al. 2023)]MCR8630496.1 GNAT family N-acetyltransferase [Paenibacillus radicis (ex Xue et al. 2023)]